MKIPQQMVNLSCGVATPMAMAFLQDSMQTMFPWLATMAMVVLCDLAFGIRKSRKLGIHVSGSMAFRETMGKLIVYTTFVIMVSLVEVAAKHSLKIALWSCLFICAIEGCSIVSNMLKPYGIIVSVDWILKAAIRRVAGLDADEAEKAVEHENIEKMKEAERARWVSHSKHEYGGKKVAKEKEKK